MNQAHNDIVVYEGSLYDNVDISKDVIIPNNTESLYVSKFKWTKPTMKFAEHIIEVFDDIIGGEQVALAGGIWTDSSGQCDIDLFLYGDQWTPAKITNLVSSINDNTEVRHITLWEGGITIFCKFIGDGDFEPARKVQIILRRFADITSVLRSFDLSIAQHAYSFETNERYVSRLGHYSYMTGIVPVLEDFDTGALAFRTYKYMTQKCVTLVFINYTKLSNEYYLVRLSDKNIIVRKSGDQLVEWFKSDVAKTDMYKSQRQPDRFKKFDDLKIALKYSCKYRFTK